MADAAAELVLQAQGIRKTYGERVVTEVLKGIDFVLAAGSSVPSRVHPDAERRRF